MVDEKIQQPRKNGLTWKILFAVLTLVATVMELLDDSSFLSSLWLIKGVGLGLAAAGFFLCEKRVGRVLGTVGFAVFGGVHFLLALVQFVAIPIAITSLGKGIDGTFALFGGGAYAECIGLLAVAVAGLLCAAGVSKSSKGKRMAAVILLLVAAVCAVAAWGLLHVYHLSYVENYVDGDSSWGFFGDHNGLIFRMIAYLVWAFCGIFVNLVFLRERNKRS